MNYVLEISKFGTALASRTEGREAALSTIAYQFNGKLPEKITLDFAKVEVMTPSWLGEFMQTLASRGVQMFDYTNRTNASVESSIEFVIEEMKRSM